MSPQHRAGHRINDYELTDRFDKCRRLLLSEVHVWAIIFVKPLIPARSGAGRDEDIDKRGLWAEIGPFAFLLPRPELVHASCLVMRFVTDAKSAQQQASCPIKISRCIA